MRRAIADAIADLRTTFPEREVVVEDLDDGHAWVTLVGVGIGGGWNRETDDVSVKLQPTFPDTEPYPFYVSSGLARVDGRHFNQVQPSVTIDEKPLSQISLRKQQMQTGETLASRFVGVIGWLRNPQ